MKKIKYIILLFTFLVCVFIVYGAYHYYAPPRLREPYQMKKPDDTLRIAYIGDSWADMHKDFDNEMATILVKTLHRPVKVQSHGMRGLTSKEIYESLYDNPCFRHFFQDTGYAYCYISVGINDTYKKLSSTYYKNSIDGIIQLLLANNIHPIIQEIPNYDIPKTFYSQTKSKKALRYLSMLINNTPKDCKEEFRNILDDLFIEKGYHDKVSIIRYKSWNNDYQNDLRYLYVGDGMHLNTEGYAKLDSVIVDEIIKQLKYNNNEYQDD